MKHRIFVDGQEGTTGLEIHERLGKRDDVEIIAIDPEKRKDKSERAKLINSADIVFLCLPDDAAKESVSLITNPAVRVIDCSTAHRTLDGWAYGIPELSAAHRAAIKDAKRVANPGCFATGFTMLMHPLVKADIVPPDFPASCHAVTGYSGGGKKLIAVYESDAGKTKFASPCFYSLGLKHKHLPEMQKHSGLDAPPLFTPIVANFYRGMTVAVPLFAEHLKTDKFSAEELVGFYGGWYKGQNFVRVLPAGYQETIELGYFNAEACNNTNNIEITVFGNERHMLAVARFDNLGKGASGAAVQNMNVMLGIDETFGL